MKTCIWCRKTDEQTTFIRPAHTIPQSLGGKQICEDVCDTCISYFGCPQKGKPSIETVLKEGLNLSRYRMGLLDSVKKGGPVKRYTSTYFEADFKNKPHSVRIKGNNYSNKPYFQEIITRQFKRGLYKVLLEEIQRQRGNALDSRYDFIREFSRHDLNGLPLLHFERTGVVFVYEGMLENPEILFPTNNGGFLIEEYGFTEFDILGHVFGLAISKLWNLNFTQYTKKSLAAKQPWFYDFRIVREFEDIDLVLNRTFRN